MGDKMGLTPRRRHGRDGATHGKGRWVACLSGQIMQSYVYICLNIQES